MRCFLGIPLDNRVKSEIKRKMKWISSNEFFLGNYVEEENLHISLKFMGDLSKKEISYLTLELKKVIEKEKICKIKVNVNKTGFFPTTSDPRIGWFGFEKDELKLMNLRSKLNEVIKSDEKFHPHITFIRIKKIIDKDFIKHMRISIDTSQIIDRICLYKSELSPTGPKYEVIDEFLLK